MRKTLKMIFRTGLFFVLILVLVNSRPAEKFLGIGKVTGPKVVEAQSIECLLPSCLPTCFPPCLPTCSPRPTPTEVQPTPTTGELTPTPTLPSEPTATSPPAVGGNGGGEPGPAGPPVCGAQNPPAPYLRSVAKIKVGEVELLWDPVEPATHYSISYGPSSSNYLYGVPNAGKVNTYRVGALGSGNYCFVVRAVNDCAPSKASNEICTGGGTPQVLGVSVLGATGSSKAELWSILFIMGMVCAVLGVKKIVSGPKLARY